MNTTPRQLRPFRFAAQSLAPVVVLAIVWLAMPAVAVCDIAPDPLSGGVNFSGSTDKVEMSEESVTLDVTATKCTTNAIFQMKNLTDAPVTMEVGFPYAYASDLQDFRVKVDGRAVKNLSVKSQGKRRLWKVWTMTFPAGKVTKVEVAYWNDVKKYYAWHSRFQFVPSLLLSFTSFKRKPKGQATDEDERQFKQLQARLQHIDVNYIMKTGAGWAGNIGKCRIEAKFHGFNSDSLISRFSDADMEYQFRDPKIGQKGLVWELKDFEPKDDIFFQVSPHFTHRELKDLIEATLKEHPHHPKLTRLLGAYCQSPLEKKRHQNMLNEMLAFWSTRFALDGPDYIDKKHEEQSFEVWFIVRWMTMNRTSEKPLSNERRQKLLPIFKAIAQRMQSQLPKGSGKTKRLKEDQIKTFRSDAERILKWVDEQE